MSRRETNQPDDHQQRLNSLTARQSLTRPLEEIPELVSNWVRVGDLTLLVGSGGVGKSTVALPLGLGLAGGMDFLSFEVPRPEKILYLDLEMGEYEFRTRLNTLLPNYPEVTGDNFHWISLPNRDVKGFKINLESDKEKLINELEAIRPKLLIVDNHTRFHGGDSNRESDMIPMVVQPLTQMITNYELAVCYLMHTPWRDTDRPRGTMAIFDAASTVIAVNRGKDSQQRVLRWTKNRSVRRQRNPSRLNTWYDPKTYVISTGKKSDVRNLLDEFDFPISRSSLAQEIQDARGIGRTSAYKKIKELIAEGEVVEDGDMLRLPEDYNE